MRLSSLAITLAILCTASVLCFFGASLAATKIEEYSETGVAMALSDAGQDWVEVEADGLQVRLFGTAPSEARRFSAINAAAKVVDGARVIDRMEVLKPHEITAPRFSIEVLRNDSGTTLIGLIPEEMDREDLLKEVERITKGSVTDLLQTADYDAPALWQPAVDYAIDALGSVPRSKISIAADHVLVKAISDSAAEKRRLETELLRDVPSGLQVELDITAPRPVITPFTLRFVKDAEGARFDACAADTNESRDRILKAAEAAGVPAGSLCTVGLGSPSIQWAAAAERMIRGLNEIGTGTFTISDADISLIADADTDAATFDRVVGRLENSLPEAFTLHATRIETEETTDGPIEFTAALDEEGKLLIQGRITDELSRKTTESYARARFGAEAVDMQARLDAETPAGWSLRVLAGIEALSRLHDGTVTVTPEKITVAGNTGFESARADVARILSEKLGEGAEFAIRVRYVEELDPLKNIPTTDECIADIRALNSANKITFDPGSSNISATSLDTMEKIAELLTDCPPFPLEIAGYTDSQGRETMNQQLSEQRAQSVLNYLMSHRVRVADFVAIGFGEANPIADNGTEEGREANRRIEFRLHTAETALEAEEALETDDTSSAEEDAAPQTEDEPTDEQN